MIEIEKKASVYQEGKKDHFDFSFLSLHPPFPFPDLDKTIRPLSFNTRPDAPPHPDLLVKIGQDDLMIPSGEQVYINFEPKGAALSTLPTSLSIKNEILEGGVVQMEVGIQLLNNEKKTVFRFEDLKREGKVIGASLFKESEILGPDCLFELFGGREYQKKKGKMRVKFPDGQLLFLETGDFFSFKEGKWSPGKDKEAPLAAILSVSPQEVQVHLWDVSGLYSEQLKLTLLKASPSLPQASTLFTKLRKKTATKVICYLGQKERLLKKGDWLIHTKKGWREIKTGKELSDCLDYKMQGELFIFEGIDKNQFVGTYFNEARTGAQKVRLPFGEEKKK